MEEAAVEEEEAADEEEGCDDIEDDVAGLAVKLLAVKLPLFREGEAGKGRMVGFSLLALSNLGSPPLR